MLAALNPQLGEVTAEDFFAYCYALLATPAYVETFSEELTVPGPRVPVTRNRKLFQQAVALGRNLIWLHTYGERFIPPRQHRGEIPKAKASYKKPVSVKADEYPEDFSCNDSSQVLRVGDGEFASVPKAVWEFSVSGLRVVHSWLSYRMKDGYGRSSSPLDEIRPQNWTAEMSRELLELLWVLEATVEKFPELEKTLASIVAGETFRADELPSPTAAERKPPSEEPDEPQTAEQDLQKQEKETKVNFPKEFYKKTDGKKPKRKQS